MRAVAASVLDGTFSDDDATRRRQLDSHLDALQQTLSGFPSHTREELSLLLGLLGSAAGRIGLAGLWPEWAQAPRLAVSDALQSMRVSALSVRQQAYHALRDLTNAAWYANPEHWAAIGYPGPRDI